MRASTPPAGPGTVGAAAASFGPAPAAVPRRPAPHAVCVVLHDVAPARWDGCTRVLAQLRRVAREAGVELPVSLLVVPRLHGDAAVPVPYLRWLHRQARVGHELVLHGLTHRDDAAPPPRGPAERLLRQAYTAGEGEFAALDGATAAARLAEGRAWARQHGLAVRGFVAPAWLLSPAARAAVAAAGFEHTSTLTEVVALPEGCALHARSLVFSTRSAWRRALSWAWVGALGRLQLRAGAPLLRLELHPGDADHPALLRCWTVLLARALAEGRRPLRLHEAAALARRGAGRGEAVPPEGLRQA